MFEKPKIFFFDVCRGCEEEPSYSKSISTNKGFEEPNVSFYVFELSKPIQVLQEESAYNVVEKSSIKKLEYFFSQTDFFFGWVSVNGYEAKHNLEHGSCY